MRRALILTLGVTQLLLAATPAAAGPKQRVAAANAVERKLERVHRRYRWVAYCDQLDSTRFSCNFVGRRRSRGATGKASAIRNGTRYTVTLGRITYG